MRRPDEWQHGHAYPCFCTAERLEERRQAAVRAKLPPIYDRRCLTLPAQDRAALLRSGAAHTVRLAVRWLQTRQSTGQRAGR